MSFEKLNIDFKNEKKEKRLLCEVIEIAFKDLENNLKLNKTSKGFSLVERGRFRANSIMFFYSKYFKLYCYLLDLPYQDIKSNVENLINLNANDFKHFLKKKKSLGKGVDK